MHLHLWDNSTPDAEDPIAEADLKPSEIYMQDKPDKGDHIQWIGTVTIEGKEYHVELRQPIHLS